MPNFGTLRNFKVFIWVIVFFKVIISRWYTGCLLCFWMTPPIFNLFSCWKRYGKLLRWAIWCLNWINTQTKTKWRKMNVASMVYTFQYFTIIYNIDLNFSIRKAFSNSKIKVKRWNMENNSILGKWIYLPRFFDGV